MVKSNYRMAEGEYVAAATRAGGESCLQDYFFICFICAAPCRGNMPLRGQRGAQRAVEDESSLLNYNREFLTVFYCIRMLWKGGLCT